MLKKSAKIDKNNNIITIDSANSDYVEENDINRIKFTSQNGK